MVVIRAPNSTPMVRTEVVDRLEALVGELQQQAGGRGQRTVLQVEREERAVR